MRVLLTRPRSDSEALAERLSGQGIECLIEPLLMLYDVDQMDLELGGVQAFLVTSANGARALGRATSGDRPARALPVFAVGDASAGAVREQGFVHVESAGGDVATLADLVRSRLDPAAGALMHATGSVTAGDLTGILSQLNFEVRRSVLYRTKPASSFTPAAKHGLAQGEFDAVLLYSPRTAATFTTLVRAAGLVSACSWLDAICLSTVVASQLDGLDLADVRVAPYPTEQALLALIAV